MAIVYYVLGHYLCCSNIYTMVYFIPLGRGSLAWDIELKYSLRSIDKYVSGIDSVLIVGKLPEWWVNVDFVQCVDISNKFVFRDNNIRAKINLALNMYDSVIGGNDDYLSMLITLFVYLEFI